MKEATGPIIDDERCEKCGKILLPTVTAPDGTRQVVSATTLQLKSEGGTLFHECKCGASNEWIYGPKHSGGVQTLIRRRRK